MKFDGCAWKTEIQEGEEQIETHIYFSFHYQDIGKVGGN